MTARRQAAVLALLCCLVYLPGLGSVDLYTRGEAREALAVREVVSTDEWLVPLRPDGRLTRKPPLFYWLGGTFLQKLPGAPEWAVRLPSVLAAIAGVLAVATLGRAACGEAALAGVLLATTFEWVRSATTARVDMVLAAGTTLVLAAWMHALARPGARWTGLTAAAGAAIAVLAKGPVGLGMPAIALVVTAAWARRPDVLRLGVPLAAGAAVAALWYLAAWLVHGQAFVDVVVAENLGRFVDPVASRTGHAHGPLYLVPAAILALLPWTPLLPVVAARGPESRPARRLAVAWIATLASIVLFSASKRQVYLLPLVPAVALLLADGLAGTPSPRLTRVLRATTVPYAPVVGLIGTAGLLAAVGALPAGLLSSWLPPEDALLADAILGGFRAWRGAFLLLAAGTIALAVAMARARAALAWRRLALLVAVAVAVWVPAFQTGIHPLVGRTRGVAAFMQAAESHVPRGTIVFTIFPVDPVVRFYAPWSLERWQRRPAGQDLYLLAWEREIARTKPARPLERLAETAGGSRGRGRLVLVRVPAGALPPGPRSAQKG